MIKRDLNTKTEIYSLECNLKVMAISNEDTTDLYVSLSNDYPLEYQFGVDISVFELDPERYINGAIKQYITYTVFDDEQIPKEKAS